MFSNGNVGSDHFYNKYYSKSIPTAQTNRQAGNELSNFIKIFFDFCYYLCLSPFRFERNKGVQKGKQEVFSFHEWKPQQFVCGAMHILCIHRIITEARLNTPENVNEYGQNPEQYFLLTMNIFNVIFKATFANLVFRYKKNILLVINFTASESLLPTTHAKSIRRATVIRTVLTLVIIMAFISVVAGKYFLSKGFRDWSPTWWYRRLVASTRYMFFYSARIPFHEAPDLGEITFIDQILSGVNLIGLISRYFLGYYTDLYIMVMGLTLWVSSFSFAKSFEDETACEQNAVKDKWASKVKPSLTGSKDKADEWKGIYEKFKALRMLSYLINKALGSIVCWFLADSILAYSMSLDAVFISRDVHKRLGLVFNYFCAFGVLFVSADVCKQMESIKLWLAEEENRKHVPDHQLSFVLHEMIVKDIGIRGADIFTITYAIVATFIGTILTYFIICVQQNTPQVS